jgi:hypothetical protein
MNRFATLATVMTLLAGANLTYAGDADREAPDKSYRSSVYLALISCRTTMTHESLLAERRQLGLPDDPEHDKNFKKSFPDCVRDQKIEVKKSFDSVLKVAKKAKAKEALKSMQVSFVLAIDGLRPDPGELKILYAQRQKALETKIDEAWARYELER